MADTINERLNSKENKNAVAEDNKKIISFILLIAFILSTIFFVSYLKDKYLSDYFDKLNPKQSIEDYSDIETYDPITDANNDDDGDGISNWREVVSGTDTSVKDFNSNFKNADEDIVITEDTNLTALLARDLYAVGKYKERYPETDVNTASQAVMSNYQGIVLPEKLTGVEVVAPNSEFLIKSYVNNMAILFNTALSNKDFIELIEYKKGGEDFTGTQKYLTELKTACVSARNVKSVPAGYVQLHIDFVYSCELYVSVLSGVTKFKTDKIRALLSLKNHREAIMGGIETFNNYVQKLDDDNIVFTKKENGYLFINRIN